MATPFYSIYIDGKLQRAFPSGESTTDRTEAEETYKSMRLVSSLEGSRLELRVSSRGLEKTLKEDVISLPGFVAETEQEPEYHFNSYEPNEQELFLGLIRELHEAGFSVPEIADISGKSERTVRYNLSKLTAANQIKSHRRGRPAENAVRDKKAVTIQFYKDNYDFLMKRFGNITNVVNDLIDKYRKELEESDEG